MKILIKHNTGLLLLYFISTIWVIVDQKYVSLYHKCGIDIYIVFFVAHKSAFEICFNILCIKRAQNAFDVYMWFWHENRFNVSVCSKLSDTNENPSDTTQHSMWYDATTCLCVGVTQTKHTAHPCFNVISIRFWFVYDNLIQEIGSLFSCQYLQLVCSCCDSKMNYHLKIVIFFVERTLSNLFASYLTDLFSLEKFSLNFFVV